MVSWWCHLWEVGVPEVEVSDISGEGEAVGLHDIEHAFCGPESAGGMPAASMRTFCVRLQGRGDSLMVGA